MAKEAKRFPPKAAPPLHPNAILFADVPLRTDLNFVTPPVIVRPARPPPEGLDRSTRPLAPKQGALRQSTLPTGPPSESPGKRSRGSLSAVPSVPTARKKPNPPFPDPQLPLVSASLNSPFSPLPPPFPLPLPPASLPPLPPLSFFGRSGRSSLLPLPSPPSPRPPLPPPPL